MMISSKFKTHRLFVISLILFIIIPWNHTNSTALQKNAHTSADEKQISSKKSQAKHKEDLKKDRAAVHQVVNQFIKYSKHSQYQKAYTLTTGKERKNYKQFLSLSQKTNQVKNDKINDIKNYFAGLKKYSIKWIYVDTEYSKAMAMCSFIFQSLAVDPLKRDVQKKHLINFFLSKKNEQWKIAFSKVNKEIYYYKSNHSSKWEKQY